MDTLRVWVSSLIIAWLLSACWLVAGQRVVFECACFRNVALFAPRLLLVVLLVLGSSVW